MSKKLLIILSALLVTASLYACNDIEDNTDNTINNDHETTESESGSGNDGTNETETGDQIDPPDVSDIKDPGEYSYIEKNDKIYVIGANLTLRTADYEPMGSVEVGTELQRIGISEGEGYWSKVLYEDQELYVSNKYTTMLEDLDEGFTAVEKTLVSVGSLKIHIAPEEDYDWQVDAKIIGWFTEGEEVKVVAVNEETGYYKVEFTPYGSNKTAFGYITSNEKYFEDEGNSAEASDKKFTVDKMSITLTSDFKAQELAGFTAAYVDEKNVVMAFIIQEKFSIAEGFEDWTLDQYAQALKGNITSSNVSETKTENGITYFDYEFTNTELNVKYYYYTSVFKSSDSFWTVQLACLAEDKAELKSVLAEYAKSVTFAD